MAVPVERLRLATAAGAVVRLQLLGGFRMAVDGVPAAISTSGQRLLALLALRGQTRRDRVAGTLWADTTQQRAMANLRTVIWRTAQEFTPHRAVIRVGRDLALDPRLDVDVDVLSRTARAAIHESPPSLDPELLRPDADVLLPDWDDEWVTDERERMHQLRLHLLEGWVDQLVQSERYGLALEAALAALRTDALRESAHRAVIKVHRAEGNISAAREAFGTCRELLARELGVEPSPQTAALVP